MKRKTPEHKANTEGNGEKRSSRFAMPLGTFVLIGLLAGPVARLVDTTIYRAQAFAATACWYLGHRQLEADARTVIAMIDYVLRDDSEVVTAVAATKRPAQSARNAESPKA